MMKRNHYSVIVYCKCLDLLFASYSKVCLYMLRSEEILSIFLVYFLDVVGSGIVLTTQRNLLLARWEQSNMQALDCIFMAVTGEEKEIVF